MFDSFGISCAIFFPIAVIITTAEEINLLCQYPSPNKQTTYVNGQNLTIVDPNIPSYPCPYDVSLWTKERMVSMSGNNQLLAFVIYFSSPASNVSHETF
jgi:outer membrane lipoprotein-sorting protein